MKTFNFIGVSTIGNKTSFRLTNDADRASVLTKQGHSNIKFWALPEPMVRADAIKWSNSLGELAVMFMTGKQPETETVAEQPTVDEDGFVEPTDELTQVRMCRMAQGNPEMTAQELFDAVQRDYGVEAI